MERSQAIMQRDGVYYIRLTVPWAEEPLEIALHGIASIADAFTAYGLLVPERSRACVAI